MTKKQGISLLAISFKPGFVSPKIPIAVFNQGEKELVLLLDSGSDKNIINIDALKLFDHTLKETKENEQKHQVSGVGGPQEAVQCIIPFSCGEEKFEEEFLAIDINSTLDGIRREHCIQIHGILGSIFLQEHNIVLDYKNLVAYSAE